MKVLVINGSPRPAGIVAQALAAAEKAAADAGADIEHVDCYSIDMASCIGCMRCRTTGLCTLPEDAAHRVAEQIREADLLIVGTPTYWAGMSARLKMIFERTVSVFMGESPSGIPQPRLKGRRAVVIAACTTPWPFSVLCNQSRGAVRSVCEVLKTGGMKVYSTEIAGTRGMNGRLPERIAARVERIIKKAMNRTDLGKNK